MAKNDITVRLFLEDKKSGTVKPWADVTEEEKQTFLQTASERLSRTMSAYYTQHPEEFALI